VGELFEENNATFRCYDNISRAKYYVSPTPLQKLPNNCCKIELLVYKQTGDTHPIQPTTKAITKG